MRSGCRRQQVVGSALWVVWVVLSGAGPVDADDVDKLINDIVRQTHTRAEAAKKLMKAVESLADAPAVQARVCEKAYEYGMTGQAGYPTALTALEMLERIAPRKLETWRDKKLALYSQQYYRGDRKSKVANGRAFIEALQTRASQCKQDDDWRSAAKHLRQAYGVARTLNLPNRKAMFEDTLAAEHFLRINARIKGLKGILAKDPADAAARRQLVTIYLVDLDMPEEAAKYLGVGLDSTLRKNVSLAAKDAAELTDEDFVTLGKWFRTLSDQATVRDSKVNLLTRARDYIRMYLEVHTKQDVKRLSALNTMKDIESQLKALDVPVEPEPPKWIDMLAPVNPTRHTIRGTWSREGTALVGYDKGHSRIIVPATAFGSYDLQLVFTVLSGAECTTVMPVGAGHVAMIFGGWRGPISGLSRINGLDADEKGNPTTIDLGRGGKMLQVGAKIILDAAVRIEDDRARIVAKLNGRKVIDWTGKQSALTLNKYWTMPIKTFSLGSYASKVVWYTAKVRLLDPADRNIACVSRDATFKISSTASKYKPLKAFLTGRGALTKGCAIHTDSETNPWAIVTLKQPVDIKRIVIFNRQTRYLSRSMNRGFRVWASSDGSDWQELWQATESRSAWMINLPKPVKARYVKFGLVGERRSYLALAGVEIYAATKGQE